MSVFHNIYNQKFEEQEQEIINRGNNTYFQHWFMYNSALLSTFLWKKVPKPTLPFQIEKYLSYSGLVAFFKDGERYLILPAVPNGELLENGEYSKYIMIARNGKTYERNRDELALCYNNSMRFPTQWLINIFAEDSSNALEAVNTALERARMPKIIVTRDKVCADSIKGYLTADPNKKATVSLNESIGSDDVKVVSMFDDKGDNVLALYDVYHRIRGNNYTMMGISNIEREKSERLTQGESQGNNEISRFSILKDMYDRRVEWQEEIKEKFDYDLELDVNRNAQFVAELKGEILPTQTYQVIDNNKKEEVIEDDAD